MTSWNVITSSWDFSELQVISVTFFIIIWIVFCYYLFLLVWIKNIIYIFIWIVDRIVLTYSLPSGDLLLQTECKYTIVQINTQYNVLVNQVFANPVSVFVLLGFRSLDNITVCILILSFCLCSLIMLSMSFQAALWTCFWNLSLFVFQSHKTFHVEEPRRTQQYQDNLSSAITPKYFVQLVWAIWLLPILTENDATGFGSHLINMVFFCSSVRVC